ncbi:MAG TPA: isopentenyl-diphosphate Delta-isomerase [Chitinophagaceae bacterium]
MEVQQVILVNEKDEVIGAMEKMEAHQQGMLHRAFSIFIFNSKGEMLLQQRALHKYHSGNLWTNACCSHPQPGEEIIQAARRRLVEEMGFEVPVEKIFDFIYKTEFVNGLIEHEFDHVFFGEYNGPVVFNSDEVKDVCYKSINTIKEDLETNPALYTAWFQIAFPKVESWWNRRYSSLVS